MGLRLQVEIKESPEELEKAVKHANDGNSKERLQMLYWLKTGQVTSRRAICERLGVQRTYLNLSDRVLGLSVM